MKNSIKISHFDDKFDHSYIINLLAAEAECAVSNLRYEARKFPKWPQMVAY